MYFPVSGIEVSPAIPLIVAFVISLFTSMGGVSGAFLILPFQVSVLGFASPAVSPTNLVYNIVAIPSGVYRYIREGRMAWPLAWIIIGGTMPGIFIGAILRIRYLPDPKHFKVFAGCVLLYIALRMLCDLTARVSAQKVKTNASEKKFMELSGKREQEDAYAGKVVVRTVRFSLTEYSYEFYGETFSFNTLGLLALTFVIGIIGGTYGIGGGAIIAPLLMAIFGLPVYSIAGAALLATFCTSIGGVLFYTIAASLYDSTDLAIAPDWRLGILFGIGGLFGMYCGARLQRYIPATVIKVVLGIAIFFLSLRYIVGIF